LHISEVKGRSTGGQLMPSQPLILQRGSLVRLKATGALFEVKEVKGDGRLIIAHGPSVLNVREQAVTVVREFNPRSDDVDEPHGSPIEPVRNPPPRP
jgi:hypothetical protein